jgi:SAM-dependent methyltransferase
VNQRLAEPPAFNPGGRDPRLADCLKDYPSSLFGERLYRSIELLERYSIDLAIDLMQRLDLIDRLADWRSANELCQQLCFQPGFTSALAWILERVRETGCIETQDRSSSREYRLHHLPWAPQLLQLRSIGLDIDPGNSATLDLLARAASLYPAVARGEQNAEQSLFGAQGVPLWLNYFHNDNSTYAVNNSVSAVLAARLLSARPKLRILELGAGPGSAAEMLLGWFDERGLLPRVERYLITEPNAFFRRRNQRELSTRYPSLPLEWQALDINAPWQAQGIALGEFNLVYAVNVIHIAKDLLFSLTEAGCVLARGGWLVIGECLRPYPNQPMYPELMFQILDSFTHVHTDPELRPNAGFLTAQQWRRALTGAGFHQVEVAPDVDHIRELYPHFFTGALAGRNSLPENDHQVLRG